MSKVCVKLDLTQYEVFVENGIYSQIAVAIKEVGLRGACALISDDRVAPHYMDRLVEQMQGAGFRCSQHLVPAGEGSKSLENVQRLCSELAQQEHDRSSFVVALGGGVVGDLAGFVASVFFRGIPFVQIPTTIVSQVDSSVGGKTGVNIAEGKNLVGAFHQPLLVMIDPEMLKTLPDREYREGYAEVIKHAAIRDREMLDELVSFDLSQMPPSSEFLARNIAIKARIVEEDEKELSGVRALLNFGHTIGHGIEAAVPYGSLLHGEAISLGIRAALYLSEKHAGLHEKESKKVLSALERFSLPLVLDNAIDTEVIIRKLKTDKKFASGQIRFVLLREIGEPFVASDLTLDDLQEAIEFIRTPVIK